MWDRTILKSNAKTALQGHFWTAYAACAVVALITGAFNLTSQYTERRIHPFTADFFTVAQSYNFWEWWRIPDCLTIIFIGMPLAVGLARFFVRNRFGSTDFSNVFSGFRDNYTGTLASMFVTCLFIGLWSLLLVIPGIIKALEYSMVPYILSDNPSMPGSRAREISSMMTNGEKGAIFVLGLSFIGWFLVAAIAVATLNWFLWPISGFVSIACGTAVSTYASATFAELYIFMRDRAIQSGYAQPAEFGLVPPTEQA